MRMLGSIWWGKFIRFGSVATCVAVVVCLLLAPSVLAAGDDTTVTGNFASVYNVFASDITQTTATIEWETTGAGTSQVFYDVVPHDYTYEYEYRSPAIPDPALVSVHSVPLIDLSSSITYYYRVKSVIDSNPFESDEHTFDTPGGGGGGGFGGAGGLPVELRIDLMGLVDWHLVSSLGEVLEDIERTSGDGRLTITLPVGTLARYEDGGVLLELVAAINRNPPPLPEGAIIIGSAYTIEPNRASFSPPMIMTFTYSVSEDVDEDSLFVAYYNVDADRWISTGGVLDIEAKTVSAEVRHLTTYALLAYIRPAAFMTSGLSISPAEVGTEQSVTISVLVGNTGALTGSYEVTLKVNFSVVETKSITLAGGASQKVSFTTTEDRIGDYVVDVNGLRGIFTVAEEGVLPEDKPEDQPEVPLAPADFTIDSLVISPIEVDVGKSVTIGVLVNNTGDLSGNYEVTLKIDNVVIATKEVTVGGGTSQQVMFTTYADTAGTYSVDVNGLTETFTVEEGAVSSDAPATATKASTWWIIGGIIAGVISGVVVWLFIVPRRAQPALPKEEEGE